MSLSNVKRAARKLPVVVWLLLATGVLAQPTAVEPTPRPEVASLWADGVNKIVRGQFGEARASLAAILKAQPGDEHYREIAAWLDRRDQVNGTREELHARQRAIYIKRAQKSIRENEWADALGWTREAMECTTREAAFMGEPWVQNLHDQALKQARTYKEEGKWVEASRIYYGMDHVFKGNTEYAAQLKECLAHSRLEALYDPDAKWRERLSSITPRIVSDALWQIHRKYVDRVDFQVMSSRAVDRLRLLADSEALAELFPSIKEADKHKQYVSRMDRLARKVARHKDATYTSLEDIFEKVLVINQQTFELPRELMIYEFLEGALGDEQALDDFTSMIWPADFAEFEKHTQGHFSGVGIQITLENNELTVVSPLEDTPAFRSGIQAGDKITHVDGSSTAGMSLTAAVQTITGPVGSEVVLTIHRPSAEVTFDVTLKREEIHIHSIKGHRRLENSEDWDFFIDRDFRIGYIRVTNFQENTSVDLRRALEQLQRDKARGLILDLRFNPGGLLRSAIEVAELFLPRNALIVSTEGMNSEPFSRDSHSGQHFNIPMVVLVNQSSASASEIVSGALKDHGRAVVVGERTFGKGSVQNLIPVGNTTAHLKLTTAYYYLPGGQCIHKKPDSESWGVQPDIEVPLVPDERSKVFRMGRDAEVIQGGVDGLPPGVVIREPEPSASEGSKSDTKVEVQPQLIEDGAAVPSEGSGPSDGAASRDTEEEAAVVEEPLEQIEYPDVDYQLETALLVMRVKLLGKLGFDILPKVRLGDNSQQQVPAGV